MKIETKFNVGDEVWFMHDNKACLLKAAEIRVFYNGCSNQIPITYSFESINGELHKNEKYVFATKEELINSL